MTKPTHPAAEIFPLIEGQEFDDLVQDIKAHGLREPITEHEGAILDGRNRYRACLAAEVMPRFVQWDREGTPEEYVISKNLKRRHLNESQRAMIAARLAGLKRGDVASQRNDDLQIRRPLSTSEASNLLNVGHSNVYNAKVVLREGTPEEIAAIEKGEASVSTVAQQISKGHSKEQRKKAREAPLSQTGKNPERIQRQQINAEVWGRIRDALTHLTSLPCAEDAARIARGMDRTGFVDQRLERALTYLENFRNEWNRNSNEDAA